jgi:hypothetical protein
MTRENMDALTTNPDQKKGRICNISLLPPHTPAHSLDQKEANTHNIYLPKLEAFLALWWFQVGFPTPLRNVRNLSSTPKVAVTDRGQVDNYHSHHSNNHSTKHSTKRSTKQISRQIIRQIIKQIIKQTIKQTIKQIIKHNSKHNSKRNNKPSSKLNSRRNNRLRSQATLAGSSNRVVTIYHHSKYYLPKHTLYQTKLTQRCHITTESASNNELSYYHTIIYFILHHIIYCTASSVVPHYLLL